MKKLTTEEFINRSEKIHNGLYDYSKTNYINNNTKVTIHCDKHGDFEQTPHAHLAGHGCDKCAAEYRADLCRTTLKEFIAKANEVHLGFYDYSLVNYINTQTKVTIVCPKHGTFNQIPLNHLRGEGCPKCAAERSSLLQRSTTEDFVEKANLIHNNKYSYNKTIYVNCETKVIITCPIHGDFEQTPSSHLRGRGCPYCCDSFLEKMVTGYLIQNNIIFFSEYTWDWLVFKQNQRVDFYIPIYNLAIECQGLQHFIPIKLYDSSDPFELRCERDLNKYNLCQEHGVKLYYFSNITSLYKNFKYPYQVYENMDDLMKNARSS